MAIPLQIAIQNLNSDESDEEDDDYVPSGCDDSEDVLDDVAEELDTTSDKTSHSIKGKRKAKSQKTPKSRKRKGGIHLSDCEDNAEEDTSVCNDDEEETQKTEPVAQEDKKKADSLWADFLSDVTPPAQKNTPKHTTVTPKAISIQASPILVPKTAPKPEKVTITKVFDFAGESVVVNEEVDANSKAAKEFQSKESPTKPSQSSSSLTRTPLGGKKPGGLGAVLGQVLDKKSKLSTLEKSKLDWNTFKREEGVEEELEGYKKGKGGYLERQAFLQRADLREFEIEKQLRTVNRSHRV